MFFSSRQHWNVHVVVAHCHCYKISVTSRIVDTGSCCVIGHCSWKAMHTLVVTFWTVQQASFDLGVENKSLQCGWNFYRVGYELHIMDGLLAALVVKDVFMSCCSVLQLLVTVKLPVLLLVFSSATMLMIFTRNILYLEVYIRWKHICQLIIHCLQKTVIFIIAI